MTHFMRSNKPLHSFAYLLSTTNQQISVRLLLYLQSALLSGLLVVALQNLAVDPQAQNLSGNLVVVSHCVALYLQFGISGHGEVSGPGVGALRVLGWERSWRLLLLFRVGS